MEIDINTNSKIIISSAFYKAYNNNIPYEERGIYQSIINKINVSVNNKITIEGNEIPVLQNVFINSTWSTAEIADVFFIEIQLNIS